jgi:hypothetical protein
VTPPVLMRGVLAFAFAAGTTRALVLAWGFLRYGDQFSHGRSVPVFLLETSYIFLGELMAGLLAWLLLCACRRRFVVRAHWLVVSAIGYALVVPDLIRPIARSLYRSLSGAEYGLMAMVLPQLFEVILSIAMLFAFSRAVSSDAQSPNNALL